MTIHLDATPSDYQIVDISPVVDEQIRLRALAVTKVAQESCFSKPLKFLDDKCDYIPFISTLTNLTDISLKRCVIQDKLAHTSSMKSYVTHLQKKSTASCVVYAIPIFGNLCKVAVSSYEHCRRNQNPTLKDIDYLNRYLDELVALESSSKQDDLIDSGKVTI